MIKKSVGKLTNIEKSRIKAGDKSVLYEKLGLVEEKDLKQLQSKFSLKKEDMEDEQNLSQIISEANVLSKKKSSSRRHNLRID